jgi:NADPH2:quinone reductase
VPEKELQESFVREAGASGFQVVINYVWGQPTEAFLSAITIRTFVAIPTEIRLVQVGEGAGPTISLPAALLRSTALIILGTAGIPTRDVLTDALQRVMAYAANRELQVDTTGIPLADVARGWQRKQSGRRIVIIP